MHSRTNNYYYRSWRWMKTLCLNPNCDQYALNGALGVTCHWSGKFDFDDFYNWIMRKLGPRPEGQVLGRKDKTGNFEPGNLQWETPQARSRHMRDNVMATYGRKTQTLAQWSEELNIPYYCLRRRYSQGMSIKEIRKLYKEA
jgi:hypothetical protein